MTIEQLLISGVSGSDDTAAHTPAGLSWAAAARKAAEERAAPAEDPTPVDEPSSTQREHLVLIGAHGGAGATTWAHILGGRDAGAEDLTATAEAALVLVARESAVGIAAAKAVLAQHADQVTAVLIVPAAPGKAHRMLQGEVRVLRGAVPVLRAPWVPGLLVKPPEAAAVDDVREKDLTRLTEQLETILEGDQS